MLNYCEAWPNRVEGSNNIFIDGVGVVPFLRSSEQFQKVVIFKNDYPNMKEVAHTVSQSSGDCVVYKDQVDKFATESESTPAMPQSMEDLPEGMTIEDVLAMSSHFSDMPLESPGMVIKGFSAEEAANDDKYDKLYRCEFDVVGEVTYGSSEGIYGDIFLYGNWSKERDDPFKSRARVYVLKTLKQDKESYLAVGMLVNLICYYANEFVATHLDRFD